MNGEQVLAVARRDRDTYLRRTISWLAPLGLASAGIGGVALLRGLSTPMRIEFWAIMCILVGLLLSAVARSVNPTSDSWFARNGFDTAAAITGITIGSIGFFDLGSFSTTGFYQSTLAILFAMSAGPILSSGEIPKASTLMFSTMWLLEITALIITGYQLIAGLVAVGLITITTGMLFNSQRIAQLVELRAESEQRAASLWKQAHRDELTGLSNRSTLNQAFEMRRGKTFVLALVDLDFFKDINDRYGHLTGDAVLVGTAIALQDSAPKESTVCRLGGDEFVVFASIESIEINTDKPKDQIARDFGNQLLKSLKDAPRIREFKVSGSIGLTVVEPNENQHAALSKADLALYESKRLGRARVVCYSTQLESSGNV